MSGNFSILIIIIAIVWYLTGISKAMKQKSAQRERDDASMHPYAPHQPSPSSPSPLRDLSGPTAQIQQTRFGSISEESAIEHSGYTVGGGGSEEGVSQWKRMSARLPMKYREPTARTENQKFDHAPDQLIPLNGNSLLQGFIFSEILSRKSTRKSLR